MKRFDYFLFVVLSFLFCFSHYSYAESRGPLKPEQAAYDVRYYKLDLSIDPESQTIDGSVQCDVVIVNPIDSLLLDLDSVFTISQIKISVNHSDYSEVGFVHSNGLVNINIPQVVESNDVVSCKIYYGGAPRLINDTPWGDGFVWGTTSTGEHWLGVACELEGGDLWWPCKDHPSDEPDSVNISLRVPDPLVCVSNGRYLGAVSNGDGTTTYHWFVSVPINNYNVTFYASDFELIEMDYESVIGHSIPFKFWVLPESYETALNHMDVFRQEFEFLEQVCGPFPFGTDKHGWAHAPYFGMEHQSIIAYGSDFSVGSQGYDYIHFHELAHEWWGNLLTAKDWSDAWIHEGMATYMEALYVEHLSGKEAYFDFMRQCKFGGYTYPLAPYEEVTADVGLFLLSPYMRGARVAHTLRYYLGDDLFFELLRRWLYPNPNDLSNEDGRQCRMVRTEDLKIEAEEITGLELDDFFTVFFREVDLPQLKVTREFEETSFEWLTEQNVPLDLNVPILINGEAFTVEMTNGAGRIAMSMYDELEIDPDYWILMQQPEIILSAGSFNAEDGSSSLMQNFPNPFSESTQIFYRVSAKENVSIVLFDNLGNVISTLVNGVHQQGTYQIDFKANDLADGVYYYRMVSGDKLFVKKLQIIH